MLLKPPKGQFFLKLHEFLPRSGFPCGDSNRNVAARIVPSQTTLIIREDLRLLENIAVTRWLNTPSTSTVTIHGFADASQLADAAVRYLTVSTQTGCDSAFFWSKTKVSPLKRLTFPRLELTAALILTKLVVQVKKLLKVNSDCINLWTYSSAILCWIKAHRHLFKTAVQSSSVVVWTNLAYWTCISLAHPISVDVQSRQFRGSTWSLTFRCCIWTQVPLGD